MPAIATKKARTRRTLFWAYFGLALLVGLDALYGPIHLGILAVIPLVVIGLYGGRWLAIVTALICTPAFALLDNDVIKPRFHAVNAVQFEAVCMAVMLTTVIWVVDRLRTSEAIAGSDSLTTLLNRRTILARVERSIRRAQKIGTKGALLFIDLDGFKAVNDRFGHARGDQILQRVAQRLLHSVRAADSVGRFGGDEFIVLLDDVPDRAHADRVAGTIEALLAAPFSNGEPKISATIGAAMFPADGTDAAAIIRTADAQMYLRKARKQRLEA